MKKLIKLIVLVVLSFFLIQCMYKEKITVFFENKSNLHIDSVIFKINNSKLKIININPSETATSEAFADSISTNKHDVTVVASIFTNGKLIKGGFYYNDLSGSLNSQYTLTLNSDMTTLLE
jgi:hypothetical protein